MTHQNPSGAGAATQHTNRLADETSPYLLQHAHNPVDWQPWDEEAIENARRDDRLIFLSIGYSTCYWCHVMERESFEDDETARLMNERFICIKVDREERPDLDDIYMMSTQLMTGHGGWPMSIWLEPETLRPVYAGTYFPPEPKHGLPSFRQVIVAIDDAWRNQRDTLLKNSERVAAAVEEALSGRGAEALGAKEISAAVSALMRAYDEKDGGFGEAPKFPQPPYLELLFAARAFVDDAARDEIDAAIRHTLDRMALGGMYDQVGGGFHRYSTDAQWLVPHFEKMLYDNAQLASIYARASALYDDAFYAEITRETLEYVMREMRGEHGAFFSAQDAEVNAREGQNYLWTPDEVKATLRDAGREDLIDLVITSYGLDRGTNFRDPHHPEEAPSNVLFLVERPEALAGRFDLAPDEFNRRLDAANRLLLARRMMRDQPGTDDKIIVSWNGLMIAAFADAGRILKQVGYVEAAKEAARFILSNMRTDDGGLSRTWRDGRAKVEAFAEDYAMFIRGLIALERAEETEEWRLIAIDLAEQAKTRFWDPTPTPAPGSAPAPGTGGGYFDTLPDRTDLFVRTKSTYDGAVPSANGVMLHNLLDLYAASGDEHFLDDAAATLKAVSSALARNPVGTAISTTALVRLASEFPERLPSPGGGPGPAATRPGDVVVEIDRESVVVSDLGSDTVMVTLHIPVGYHINAHDPGDPRLAGLLVQLIGGEGIVATAAYPPPETWRDIRVHTGTIQVPVQFQKVGEVTGEPKIAIRWQSCTERECLEPQMKVLGVAFDVR